MSSKPQRASAAKTAALTQPAKRKGWILETPPPAPGESPDRLMAQVAADGIVGNARSLVCFSEATFGELSLTDCAKVMKSAAQVLNDGDLSATVTMLSAQAVALNAMFGELARRASLNMGQHLGAAESYMRLALKAQGQCRATLETLATIKNPPLVIARQANINNGGQQQVNNGSPGQSPPVRAGARAGENADRPNKLLESSDGERMDGRTEGAASCTHPDVATLAGIHRPADHKG